MHHLEELVLLGILAFGAYELYHLERYGNFGIGNPNHHHHHRFGTAGFGVPYGYSDPMAGYGATLDYGNPTFGHYHGHHHHHIL